MTPETLTRLLFLLLLIPLCGGLGLLAMPKGQSKTVKTGALIFSLAAFIDSLVLAWFFDWSAGTMQWLGHVNWVPGLALAFNFGLDALSMWMVLLTTFISLLAIVGSFNAANHRVKEFYVWLLLLEAVMLGAFMSTDLIFFYVCFEFSVIPIYFLIGVHGSANRAKAARLFFFYALTGSMLMFSGILYVAYHHHLVTGAWGFSFAQLYASAQTMSYHEQLGVFLALMAGLAVKIPLFPLHTWQPSAYTEAPTAGTIMLACVLLKLSTYGLIRLVIPLAPQAVVACAPWIAVLAVIGILYAALISWVQRDMKKLIAYSSMSHMGFCVLGIFALNMVGLTGAVAYMVNHGLTTAALFLCVGMLYERFGTRQINELGGLARLMPVWAFFMVFFVFASVGLPGLNGFVGEFLTLLGAFTQTQLLGPWYAAFAGLGIILAAIYLLYITGKVVFGPIKLPKEHGGTPERLKLVRDLNLREIAVLTPLAIGCLWLGLYPQPLLAPLETPLKSVVATANIAMDARLPLASRQPVQKADQSNIVTIKYRQPGLDQPQKGWTFTSHNRIADGRVSATPLPLSSQHEPAHPEQVQ